MYKCTSCGHTQDMEGPCQQCGSDTAAADDQSGDQSMPEVSSNESSSEDAM